MRVCFWQAGSVSYGRVCLKINQPCLKHTTAALYSRCLEYVVYVWFELYLGRVLGYDCEWINLMWIHYANVRLFPVHWGGDLQLDVFEGQLILRRRARACKLDVREAIAIYTTLFQHICCLFRHSHRRDRGRGWSGANSTRRLFERASAGSER